MASDKNQLDTVEEATGEPEADDKARFDEREQSRTAKRTAGMVDEQDGERRPIGVLLMIGLLTVPLVFGWLLLRPGYANSTRILVLVYALLGPALVFIASFDRRPIVTYDPVTTIPGNM